MALVCVGFLSWRGSGFIEKAKTWGSAALYVGYCAFAVLVLTAPVEAAATAPVGAASAAAVPEVGALEVVINALLYVPTTSPSCRPCSSASIGRPGAPRRLPQELLPESR